MESLHLFALALQLTTVAPPQVAGPSVGDFLGYDNPPAEMVDFLGRRRLCAERAVDLPEEEWLRCADLAGEELGWRARAGADADVLRWLDQSPREFELAGRESVSLTGANSMRPQRVEHSGTDAQGRPYRLNILTGSDEGRSTRIVTSYDGGPTRSFTIDGRRFPLIDLQSVQVSVRTIRSAQSLEVELSYGHDRPYCRTQGDNRARVLIFFERDRIWAQDVRRTNCEYYFQRIENAAP